MAFISTRDKRDKLRLIWANCQSNQTGLEAALLAALVEADAAVGTGKWVSGTSGNGRTVSLSVLATFTPLEARRLAGELNDLFAVSTAALAEASSATPADSDIFSEMMSRLIKPGPTFNDFTLIRLPWSTAPV